MLLNIEKCICVSYYAWKQINYINKQICSNLFDVDGVSLFVVVHS